MNISDTVEKNNLLSDPNKNLIPYTGSVQNNFKGELKEGMLNDECSEYFDNGKIASIINYNKNKMYGRYETFITMAILK